MGAKALGKSQQTVLWPSAPRRTRQLALALKARPRLWVCQRCQLWAPVLNNSLCTKYASSHEQYAMPVTVLRLFPAGQWFQRSQHEHSAGPVFMPEHWASHSRQPQHPPQMQILANPHQTWCVMERLFAPLHASRHLVTCITQAWQHRAEAHKAPKVQRRSADQSSEPLALQFCKQNAIWQTIKCGSAAPNKPEWHAMHQHPACNS